MHIRMSMTLYTASLSSFYLATLYLINYLSEEKTNLKILRLGHYKKRQPINRDRVALIFCKCKCLFLNIRCLCSETGSGPLCGRCSGSAYQDPETDTCVDCGCSMGSSRSQCSDDGTCTCDIEGGGDRPDLADSKCVSNQGVVGTGIDRISSFCFIMKAGTSQCRVKP